jgi:riboflavin synthase
MFTGIVHHVGRVKESRPFPGQPLSAGRIMVVETEFRNLVPGESISVNGVCLTATARSVEHLDVEISPETLDKSELGQVSVGSAVNLERALKLGDSIGGHWVTGHVDTIGEVTSVETLGGFTKMSFGKIAPEMHRWLIPKGSVAINGVSLTVNEVTPLGFSVMLIPHTLEKTNLKTLAKLSPVNLEFDWMVKTVLRDLGQRVDWIRESNV